MKYSMQVITIDGPVASGKSTIARALAHAHGWYYLYSGLWYRALAYCWLQHASVEALQADQVAVWLAHLDPADFVYQVDSMGNEHMCIDQVDVTTQLHTAAIDEAASRMSVYQVIRTWVNDRLRAIALQHTIVADGRDMGSEVFPHAVCKIFLTASVSIRAQRWRTKQAAQGHHYSQAQAEQQIQERDNRDAGRATAPLVVPAGAYVCYNNGNDPSVVVKQLLELCARKGL